MSRRSVSFARISVISLSYTHTHRHTYQVVAFWGNIETLCLFRSCNLSLARARSLSFPHTHTHAHTRTQMHTHISGGGILGAGRDGAPLYACIAICFISFRAQIIFQGFFFRAGFFQWLSWVFATQERKKERKSAKSCTIELCFIISLALILNVDGTQNEAHATLA